MEKVILDDYLPLELARHSSKGNQLKWKYENNWYKADHMGYEGLSEVIVSQFLSYSNVIDYVKYTPAQIKYREENYRGCKSKNFLNDGEELVTVEHLFRQYTGKSLSGEMGRISDVKDRIMYATENVAELTGLTDFGKYMSILLALDSFFLNEDRHTNNIAVIYRPEEEIYRFSPIFDNGLALFSDTATDFGMEKTLEDCMKRIEAKPFDRNFDKQLDAIEELYGQNIHFSFGKKEVEQILQRCSDYYPVEILERVREILYYQMRKYKYMFIG